MPRPDDLFILEVPCPCCRDGILLHPRGPLVGDSLCRNCEPAASGMGSGTVRVTVRRADVERALRAVELGAAGKEQG